jgi:hypothetical protein
MANNPFTSFSCDPSLDAFPVSQSCTTYDQLDSQIAGMIVLPDGAPKPTDWATIEGWAGVVDNTDQSLMKGRYLVGVGSFLPNGKQEVELSGGRYKTVGDRSYRLDMTVLQYAPGHESFARKLESGYRSFSVWAETVGGRIIGGPNGMRPFFPDSEFPFQGGENDKEQIRILLDFFFPNIP